MTAAGPSPGGHAPARPARPARPAGPARAVAASTGRASEPRVTDVEARADDPRPQTSPPGRRRRRWIVGLAVVVVWSLVGTWSAGAGVLNAAGWPQLRAFLAAALRPELDAAFLRVVAHATLTTVGYAVLGTALAMVIGLIGGVVLAETWWRRSFRRAARPPRGWYVARGLLALPRGVHEAVWALALASVLGLDPLVGVLGIGIPFGAVSAKVVGELIDETAGGAYAALRAGGAGRVAALLYGAMPVAGADIVSYGFYRFECAMRAAAILGVIGAGGLGFELALSFQALQYGEMWTLTYALVAVSGLADLWSARLRRGRRRSGTVPASLIGGAVLIVLSANHLAIDPTTLWAADTRDLAGRLLGDAWPPGGHRLDELLRLGFVTLQMSVAGAALAAVVAVPAAFVAARGGGPARTVVSLAARAGLLLLRAVPPPVWAFVLLLVLFPGPLPGAAALAVYNLGVLGRLMAEVVENVDDRPAAALRALGAREPHVFAYGVLPEVAPRFAAYGLYRWEVALRETVIVGLVGAGGLGRLLAEQLAAFDHAGALTTVLVLVGLAALVDLLSGALRRNMR